MSEDLRIEELKRKNNSQNGHTPIVSYFAAAAEKDKTGISEIGEVGDTKQAQEIGNDKQVDTGNQISMEQKHVTDIADKDNGTAKANASNFAGQEALSTLLKYRLNLA